MESRARYLSVITILIAFALLHSGEARRCYSCSSEQSNTCANAPASHETNQCSSALSYCMTCNGRNTDNNPFVFRDCAGLFSNFVFDNMECKICNGELCNSGNSGNGSLPLSISMAALGGLILLWATRFVLIDF